MNIKITRLKHSDELPLPCRMSDGASGFDIPAAIEYPVTIKPLERIMIPTGFCFECPKGYELQIRPRSGLATKYGITVLNSPGTIDSDYRGEVKVILINLGDAPFTINRGDRIAQVIPSPVCHRVIITEEVTLTTTGRECGGFGHTGIN